MASSDSLGFFLICFTLVIFMFFSFIFSIYFNFSSIINYFISLAIFYLFTGIYFEEVKTNLRIMKNYGK